MKKSLLLLFIFSVLIGDLSLIKGQGLSITPSSEVLMTGYSNPRILSLNNSLIDYNDQPTIFNQLAVSAGKTAVWEKQTRLGMTLRYHYEEGDGLLADGTPTARYRIRSQAWTHIILQEQSDKPLTNYSDFLASVQLWVNYIRAYCPNPNARIILFMNWPYTDASDFSGDMNTLWNNYMSVAVATGISVIPVGKAYDIILAKDGVTVKNSLYSDNRHPTPMATYLSACTILASLYEMSPVGLSYHPGEITTEQATLMQERAYDAWQSFSTNTSDINGKIYFQANVTDATGTLQNEPTIWSVDGGGTIDANGVFSSNKVSGNYMVTAVKGTISTSAPFQVKAFIVPPTVAALSVSPLTSTITLGQTKQFSVSGFDLAGNAINLVYPTTWSVTGTGVTIDANGLLTATQKGVFTVTATNSNVSKSVTIEVLPANPNLSVAGVATASSALQVASLAIDNNSGSRWESAQGVDPQWITVDLGEVKNITDVILKWETASAKNYTIDYSSDNINWQTAVNQTNMSAVANRVDRMYDVNISARYVRMLGSSRTTSYGYSIYEFQLYGTAQTGNVPNLSFAIQNSVTKNAGESAFTNLASSTNSSGNITYSSSNTSVATVNAATGEVTLTGAGVATISATIAADASFTTATASYILYVNGYATVSTESITNITTTGASAGGNVSFLGYPSPTQYGHCWSTTATPTIQNSITTKGSLNATGTFISEVTGLSAATTYYIRAYATNSSGTVYGQEYSFTTLASVPVAGINSESAYYQTFDEMGRGLVLPAGWKIQKMTGSTAQRVVGTYSAANTSVDYTGGANMSSTASNGTYNFGNGDAAIATDRAIGGSTTGAFTSTQGVNFYLYMKNTGVANITSLSIAYDVEKYRYGSQTAGFVMQMYYSGDGINWTTAGNNFLTSFAADGTTAGAAVVPIQTKSVSATLPFVLNPGSDLYLAWNYSVASGSTSSSAQQLALDNVSVRANKDISTDIDGFHLKGIYYSPQTTSLVVDSEHITHVVVYSLNAAIVAEFEHKKVMDLGFLKRGVYIVSYCDTKGNRGVLRIIK